MTTTGAEPVRGLTREEVARAICKTGAFCCENGEARCNAMDWYGDAADAVLELANRPAQEVPHAE